MHKALGDWQTLVPSSRRGNSGVEILEFRNFENGRDAGGAIVQGHSADDGLAVLWRRSYASPASIPPGASLTRAASPANLRFTHCGIFHRKRGTTWFGNRGKSRYSCITYIYLCLLLLTIHPHPCLPALSPTALQPRITQGSRHASISSVAKSRCLGRRCVCMLLFYRLLMSTWGDSWHHRNV